MSIRHVKCPACGTGANVPVAMASAKCVTCGTVWNPSQSGSATRSATTSTTQATAETSASTNQSLGLIAVVSGAIAVLVTLSIAVVMFVGGQSDPPPPDSGKTAPVAVATPGEAIPVETIPIEADALPSYREVDLPESTRKQIYLDYRKLVGSSTEKKLMILKDSPVGQSVRGMLEQTVDREITHFSSIHNISREDVFQIVAEGDAKQWPGARPPEPPANEQSPANHQP